MDIDLFLTKHSEAGLMCDSGLPASVAGVILDAQTHELTLELSDGGTLHLNIPVEIEHKEKMLFASRMYVGFFEKKMLTDAFEVPLLYLNDPYGSDFGQGMALTQPKRAVVQFEQFMKRCSFAQALHRDNLGDENSARSILRGVDPHALPHAPTLARQLQLGITAVPKTVSSPQAPGLGGGATAQARIQPPKTAKTEDED